MVGVAGGLRVNPAELTPGSVRGASGISQSHFQPWTDRTTERGLSGLVSSCWVGTVHLEDHWGLQRRLGKVPPRAPSRWWLLPMLQSWGATKLHPAPASQLRPRRGRARAGSSSGKTA